MLRTENLSKTYRISRKNKVDALKNVNLRFGDAGLVAIVGKSGCGKTTLLNLLGTLDVPSSGKLYVSERSGEDEICISDEKEAGLNDYRNRFLGMVFQNYNLIDEWTVDQNVRIGLEQQDWKDKSEEGVRARVEEALRFVELEGLGGRYIKELSGGQQQRAAIARAIVKSPRLLLADEPTGNLDSESSEHIMRVLRKCAERCLVVVVTHDAALAEEFADRIIRMRDGAILEDRENEPLEKSGQAEGLAAREQVVGRRLSAGTICHLAGSALRIKKIKLALSLLVLIMVACIAKLAVTFLTNDFGKAVAEYLVKNDEQFLLTYEEQTFRSREGFEYALRIKNRTEVKELLSQTFGERNCYAVLEGAELTVKDAMEDEAVEGRLVIGGVCTEGYELLGELPKAGSEILITDYIAFALALPDDCVGETILVNGLEMTVCGVLLMNSREVLQNGYEREYRERYAQIAEFGPRLLVSEDYPNYLREQSSLLLPFAALTENHLYEEPAWNKARLSGSASVEASGLLWGRLPEKDSEIVLSLDYAAANLLATWDGELLQDAVSFFDLHGAAQNGAFNGYLALRDYIPDVTIVGILDQEPSAGDIILSDALFARLKEDYCDSYCADGYEVALNEKTRKNEAIYDRLDEAGILLDMQETEVLYERRGELEPHAWIFQIAVCFALFLMILLMILFFSFNVKDNHEKIGILRALGVSYADVTRIWLTEAILVCALTAVGSFAVNGVFFLRYNAAFRDRYGFLSDYIHHNLWAEGLELVCLLVLTVLTVAVPVWIMSDKKPMELIRSRE
ncbi:MAG: ATP-binding cassette domain-containing protein [Lachnospiraceae bacterium]|nr:ATP-binding cassette domain-containing protein [Lachnospiraceae bacterium]